ncbi:hypothetical protein [Neptunomonas japonica]|uniref:hypothetical protein n=1 Tax=Neptunomonas japonica TaxID=417574 RepID=UPI00040E8346|nr:hypothetical protein [Neptunomonas japonica]
MDMASVPRSFWHALSFCMVAATLGLLFIAQSSSNVSIEIANAKIELSSAISQVKDIKSDLKAENARLVKANLLLQEKVKRWEAAAKLDPNATSLEDFNLGEVLGRPSPAVQEPITQNPAINPSVAVNPRNASPKDLYRDIDAKIQSAEKYIRSQSQ